MMRMRLGLNWGVAAAVAIALCCTASTANAAATLVGGAAGTGSLLKLYYSSFPGTDGEFGAFVSTNAPSGAYANANAGTLGKDDFRTFCVQLNELVNDGETVRVDAISKITASTNPDMALTATAAWLFREYSKLRAVPGGIARYKGDIPYAGATFNYNSFDASNNVTDPNLLQQALWSLMGWSNAQILASGFGPVFTTTANNKYMAAVSTAVTNGDVAAMTVTANSIGGVSVLNLVKASNGAVRQDMLYYNPNFGSSTAVPEPMSAGLWLTTLVVGACVYRRRQNRN